jgi:hypothetical protein
LTIILWRCTGACGPRTPYVLRNHPELILTPFALGRKYGFETDAELDRLVENRCY